MHVELQVFGSVIVGDNGTGAAVTTVAVSMVATMRVTILVEITAMGLVALVTMTVKSASCRQTAFCKGVCSQRQTKER